MENTPRVEEFTELRLSLKTKNLAANGTVTTSQSASLLGSVI